jgi:5-methyltetrahydrofolate--homocysteine methyltransferase
MGNASDNEENIYVAKANCGIPEYVEGKIHYNGTPEIMADYVRMAIDAGARIIGGCCGTTPEHIRAMREALDEHIKGEKPTVAEVEARLGEVSVGAKAQNRGEMSVMEGAISGGDGAPRKARRRKRD